MKRLMIALALLLMIGLLTACDASSSGNGGGGSTTVASPTPEGAVAPTSDGGDIIQPGTGEGAVNGDPQSGDDFQTGTLGSGFIADVSGPAFNGRIEGEGYFACENDRYVIRRSDSGLEQVTLILPPDVTPGTYSFGDMSQFPDSPSAMVTLEDNRVFAGSVIGTLILNTVADAPNEIVSGSYEFNASNGQSNLSVEGSFEFRSAEDVAYCG